MIFVFSYYCNYVTSLFVVSVLLGLSTALPEVTIAQGRLQGKTFVSEKGFSYDGYRGIPYAKPPVGDLRFKDPVPADKWEGVYNASVEKNYICPQINKVPNNEFSGSEDCLYLNVYVPQNTTTDSNLAVMFWIHGGCFTSGSGIKSQFGPDYLVENKGVILVTINYRLGALGFLCLHTADAPGNAGLKDQVLALKWVQENIKQFGGDPKQVTIFGESAGSASVHYLMMSPTAKGLYSKAILESGTSFNEWAFQNDSLKVAFALGKILGVDTESKEELFHFLKTIPETKLIKAASSSKLNKNNTLPFSPVAEQFQQATSFLIENPKEILKGGKYNIVPTLSGFMSNEGSFHAAYLKDKNFNNMTLDTLIPNFEKFIPKDLKSRLDADKKLEVIKKIKEFYFKTEENLMDKMFLIWTDFVFVKDIDFSTKLFVLQEPNTFYFRFSYNGAMNIMKQYINMTYKGASHGDELGYLFVQKNVSSVVPTDTDKKIISLMTEMWTNFAKFGNPTPQLSDNIKVLWKPVTTGEINCLDINEESTLIQNPYQERMQFWQDLYLM